MAFIIVIASSGRISFPLHAWPPGSRLCQLTQTRYQLTQTRYGEFRLSTPMKSVAFMIVIDFTSGRISFPLHSWPLGSRLCQLTQTRYQLTQTRYGVSTPMKSVAFIIVIASSGRICHSDFGPGDFGPAEPKSPENTAGISVRPGDHNHQRYWSGSRYFGPGSRFTLGEPITLLRW